MLNAEGGEARRDEATMPMFMTYEFHFERLLLTVSIK